MSNLKDLRIETGMSQSKLAAASGVSVRMIQFYEQGVKDINKAQAITVYNLAKAIGTTSERILEIH